MGNLNFASTQMVYVAVGGNDTTGDGSIGNPFATVSKALSVITTASSNNRFIIKLMGGKIIDTTTPLLKPWVYIVGDQEDGTYWKVTASGNNIGVDPSFVTGRAGITNVYLGASTNLNLDFYSIGPNTGTPSAVIDLEDIYITGNLNYYGRTPDIDYLQGKGLFLFGTFNADALQVNCNGCVFNGNVNLTSNQAASNSQYNAGIFQGNVVISGTHANAEQLTSNPIFGTLTISGTNTVLTADAVSLPTQAKQTISGGAQIATITDSYNLNYVATTPGNWPTPIPSTVTSALDSLATPKSSLSLNSNLIQFGTLDPFSRTQIWNKAPSPVLRLGSWISDGDPTNVASQGIVVYGDSLLGTPIDQGNGSYARVKNNRFGLFDIDSTLPAYTGGAYYFRADDTEMFYADNSGNKTFQVGRVNGNISSGNIHATSNNIVLTGSTTINSNIITVSDSTGVVAGMWVADSAGAFTNSNYSPTQVESLYLVQSINGNDITLNYAASSTQASDTFTFSKQSWLVADYGVANRGLRVGIADGFGRPTLQFAVPNSMLKLGMWNVDGDPYQIPSQGLVTYFNSINGAPLDNTNGSIQLLGQNMLWFANQEAGNFQSWFNVDPTSIYYADSTGAQTFSVQRATGQVTTTGGVQLSTSASQPACTSSLRGLQWNLQGGAGVADIYQICQKDASDNYVWVTH
jgi:hypothetical protein